MGWLERYHWEVIFFPAVSAPLAVPCALYHAHGTVGGTKIGPTHSVFFHARPDPGPARFRAHGTVNSEQGYMNMWTVFTGQSWKAMPGMKPNRHLPIPGSHSGSFSSKITSSNNGSWMTRTDLSEQSLAQPDPNESNRSDEIARNWPKFPETPEENHPRRDSIDFATSERRVTDVDLSAALTSCISVKWHLSKITPNNVFVFFNCKRTPLNGVPFWVVANNTSTIYMVLQWVCTLSTIVIRGQQKPIQFVWSWIVAKENTCNL